MTISKETKIHDYKRIDIKDNKSSKLKCHKRNRKEVEFTTEMNQNIAKMLNSVLPIKSVVTKRK